MESNLLGAQYSLDTPVTFLNFTYKNIIVLIIVIAIIILGFYYFNSSKFSQMYIKKSINSDYHLQTLRNEEHGVKINNKNLECPHDNTKYSFSFFLEIHDFYCNRGYWKCVMLKGSEIRENDIFNKCSEIAEQSNIENTFNSNCFNSTCENEFEKCKTQNINDSNCKELKINSGEQINIYKNTNLFEKLDKICKAHKLGEEGKNLLCCGASKCGYFIDESDIKVNITKGQCLEYLNKFSDYCGKVYAVDKKVSRNSEELRLKNKTHNNKERYYDDYDGMCSVDNYLENNPKLLPKNIETLDELRLINLSKKNNMDVGNPTTNQFSIEGLYLNNDLVEKLEKEEHTTEEHTTYNNLQKCNEKARELGYNFFAMGSNKCKMLKTESEEELYKLDRKPENDCGINNNEVREGSNNCYFVSKARKFDDLVVIKCWEDIIKKYPYQSPGVWLHPYVNNLRIVYTTYSNKKYDHHINDIVHPHKETNNNYTIEEIVNDTEHPEIPDNTETDIDTNSSKCRRNIFNPSKFIAYREYFDIYNIPIMEKFHIAIITNNKHVEVYIDGKLKNTQTLFGNPKFNNGLLQINPSGIGVEELDIDNENLKREKIMLGGTIYNFKYFSRAINSDNIKNIMNDKNISQQIENNDIVSDEHNHNIEISHDHSYSQDEEINHVHSVGDSEISNDYYLEN